MWYNTYIYMYILVYSVDISDLCTITARRLVLPGDLQGHSRHVDHDDDDMMSNWGGRIKPLLKNLQWM